MKTQDKFDLISDIADRAIRESSQLTSDYKMSLTMDLDSVSDDIDLEKLYAFPEFDFMHDVIGIMNHMDRSEFPGKLSGCFLPRCSL